MTSAIELSILDLIQQRSTATVEGNLELLDELLSSDFRYINKWGDLVRRESYFRQKSQDDAQSYWVAQTIDETEITLIDEATVLVTFRVLDHQVFEGEEMRDFVRTTYLCRKIEGKWQLVFGQTSPIEPDDPDEVLTDAP